MVDVFDVADLLVAKVVGCYPDDVDLVAYYGSYAKGTATPGSDLDIFYVPAEGKNPPVRRTVLVEGILFDFWPIPWDKLEGFASGRLRGWSVAPSLVYYAKVLYKRLDEAEMRLNRLKQDIVDLQKPASRWQMIRRSLDMFPVVLARLGNLQLAASGGRLADVRNAGLEVVFAAWECLALANQVFFDQGLRSIISQSSRLHSKPEGFEDLVMTVGISSDPVKITAAAEMLALRTREVLRRFQQSIPIESAVSEQFSGAYPEIKDGFRKVVSACERQHLFDASVAVWSQQVELCHMLHNLHSQVGSHYEFNLYSEFSPFYEALGLPDLMGCMSDDFTKLAEETEGLDQRLKQWLEEHSIGLETFGNIEEFARSL